MNDDKCVFCQIINGELPSKTEYEDEKCIVFHSIEPVASTHLLIVPKKHIASVDAMEDEDVTLLGHLFKVARDVAKRDEISGYKLLMNVGKDGGQVIFHIHLHFLAGKELAGIDLKNT